MPNIIKYLTVKLEAYICDKLILFTQILNYILETINLQCKKQTNKKGVNKFYDNGNSTNANLAIYICM